MLLKFRHIGIKDGRRVYWTQGQSGRDALIGLLAAPTKYNEGARVEIRLLGTPYLREYPACGELDADAPPRIRDLDGGYQTVATFLATFEHATPEQRADLYQYDKDIPRGKRRYGVLEDSYMPRRIRKRAKWPVRQAEDRPRELAAVPSNGGGAWYRVQAKDLRTALKGTRHVVRIGSATIKPAILRQLLTAASAKQIELRDGGGTLDVRTPDKRTRCTIKHGAGDPYAGRNGFEARIVLAAA